MSKTITLREANQSFSRCVRDVEAGEEFVITRNGRPVARLSPLDNHRMLTPKQAAARARALAKMRKGSPIGSGGFDRHEIYDDRAKRHGVTRQP